MISHSEPLVGNWSALRAKRQAFSLQDVSVKGFLGEHIGANPQSIIAGASSPIPERFRCLAQNKTPSVSTERLASDSDLYKWLEGACYTLATLQDAGQKALIRQEVDRAAEWILSAQAPDGYINTQVPPYKRFDTRVNHDLYIAGHFFEAAVAHAKVTAETTLLDAACRWADLLCQEYDNAAPYMMAVGEREHPEVELGLVRLYRATRHEKYLELAQNIARMCKTEPPVATLQCGAGNLHAVRVGYLLTARAELFAETGDPDWLAPLVPLWQELVDTRLYITGGIGQNERIPETPHDLPETLEDNPDRDIAETCASVAMMMFTWRLQSLASLDNAYDVIERILYNHYMGALSLDHLGNFYYNPLRVVGDQTGLTDHGSSRTARKRLHEIHSTACCMPNSWRFWAQLAEYVFSHDDNTVYVNLYTSARLSMQVNGHPVSIQMETDYPHSGHISVTISTTQDTDLALCFRCPGWAEYTSIAVNGQEPVRYMKRSATIRRLWKNGDRVDIELPMTPHLVFPHPENSYSHGKAAIARGPLIYCLENTDNTLPLESYRIPLSSDQITEQKWEPVWDQELRVIKLKCEGVLGSGEHAQMQLIPFYARANRQVDARWTTFIPISQDL